jgi:hypothetical protein
MNAQRYYRGWKARRQLEQTLRDKNEVKKQNTGARLIQNFHRMGMAKKAALRRRALELQKAHDAATCVRAIYLGHAARQRYLEIKDNLVVNETTVVVLQRFARGFLVRRRLMRSTALVQETVWAAVEIQRNWRAYVGRRYVEEVHDICWSRHFASVRIQRVVRGWIARCRCLEFARLRARVAFELSLRRYRAAQKIQAFARGSLVREVLRVRREHISWSVITIQRWWRVASARANLKYQWNETHAPVIQASVKGFLVRRRRHDLDRYAALIQTNFRLFCRTPSCLRDMRREAAQFSTADDGSFDYFILDELLLLIVF